MATNLELATKRVQESKVEYEEATEEHNRLRLLSERGDATEADAAAYAEAKKRLSRAEGNLSQARTQLSEAAENHENPNARRPEPEHGYRGGVEADDDKGQPLDPVARTRDLGEREREMKGRVPARDIEASTFNDGGVNRIVDRAALQERAASANDAAQPPLEVEETETDLDAERPKKGKKGWLSK